jgi:hypothetical protein
MTLWTILPSPLMFGGNVPALGTDATGPWTTALLANEEVLAIDQDALGARGRRLRHDASTEVWTRPLAGGRTAVALFNRGSQDAAMTVSLAELGLSGPQIVRDLWRRSDVTGVGAALRATVPHEAALLFTFSPASGGSSGGGSTGGGSGSTSGSGSSSGSGSTSGSGSSSGSGSTSGTGSSGGSGSTSSSGSTGGPGSSGGSSGGLDPDPLESIRGRAGIGNQVLVGAGCGAIPYPRGPADASTVLAAVAALSLSVALRRRGHRRP